VERLEKFVNSTPVQSTLREMHQLFSSPRTWIGLAATVGMLTAMGPFGTIGELEFAPRLVYWAGIVLLTAPVGFGFIMCVSLTLETRKAPALLARFVAGALAGIPVAVVVSLWNLFSNPPEAYTPAYLARLFSYTTPVTVGISVIFHLIGSSYGSHGDERSGKDEPQLANSSPPANLRRNIRFLQRLPLELGNDLVSLQAQDHYVRAVTLRGSEMVLMRLTDAEEELQGIQGLRVHRSWWVADAHLDRLERRDGKPVLVLGDGTRIPVSRTYLSSVRQHLAAKQAGQRPSGNTPLQNP